MSAISKRNLTGYIADWVNGLDFEQIPLSVRRKAKSQLLGTLASYYSGARSKAGRGLIQALNSMDSNGNCRLVPSGERISLGGALIAQPAFSVVYDFDDYLFMGHTGHSSVAVPFVLGQHIGLGGRDFILAQVIANEVGGRLGASVLLGPHNGQAWSYIHALSAASVTARLLNLGHERTIHALGISLSQPNWVLFPGFMGPDSKVLTPSLSTHNGVMSSYMAREGLSGPRNILDHPQGFWSIFSYAPLKGMMSGLGRSWVTETLSIKRYPGCAYLNTALDSIFSILVKYRKAQGRNLRPEDVDRIVVEAGALTIGMNELWRRNSEEDRMGAVDVNFSVPLSIALSIMAGRLTPRELEEEYMSQRSGEIKRLSRRVILEHDPEMTMKLLDAVNNSVDINALLRETGIVRLIRAARRLRKGAGSGVPFVKGGSLSAINLQVLSNLTGIVSRHIKGGLSRIDRAQVDLGDVEFAEFKLPFPARVTLKTRDGQRFDEERDVPIGAPGGGKDLWDTAEEKFSSEAGHYLGKGRIKEIISTVFHLERCEDIRTLIDLCLI